MISYLWHIMISRLTTSMMLLKVMSNVQFTVVSSRRLGRTLFEYLEITSWTILFSCSAVISVPGYKMENQKRAEHNSLGKGSLAS